MKKENKNVTVSELNSQLKSSWEKVQSTLAQIEEDMQKFIKGNNVAGTRVRKGLQESKTIYQDMRICIQEIKGRK